MTIASEISRLQTAKACIKASIEGKGVSIPSNLTLEDYYCCIDELQVKPNGGCISYLIVGGGGGGAYYGYGGGGGGGAICVGSICSKMTTIYVTIGCGGGSSSDGGSSCICNTCFSIIAKGGCKGYGACGGNSGSGCAGKIVSSGSGYGGGGGGACGASTGGGGGLGYNGMGGGGGGGATDGYGGQCGGGTGGSFSTSCNGCNATGYGGGGGGGGYRNSDGKGGSGCQGVVDICYKIDGSCGFKEASGGDCFFTCNGYCVHRFISGGTFMITG